MVFEATATITTHRSLGFIWRSPEQQPVKLSPNAEHLALGRRILSTRDFCKASISQEPPLPLGTKQRQETTYSRQCSTTRNRFWKNHSPILMGIQTPMPPIRYVSSFNISARCKKSGSPSPKHFSRSWFCLSTILLVILFLWIHSSHSSLAKEQPLPDQAVLSRWGCGIAMCRLRERQEGTCRGHVCNFSWVEYALVRGPIFPKCFFSCRLKTDWGVT